MNCKKAEKLMVSYVDNEVSDEIRYKIERHMDNCIDCKVLAERLVSIGPLLDEFPCIEAPMDFSFNVLNRVEIKEPLFRRIFLPAPIFANLALGGFIFLVFLLGAHSGRSLFNYSIMGADNNILNISELEAIPSGSVEGYYFEFISEL